MAAQVFQVLGMTCGHCVSAVSAEIEALPGVRAVHVDLVPGKVSDVKVEADVPLEPSAVRAAVDEAGYELVG